MLACIAIVFFAFDEMPSAHAQPVPAGSDFQVNTYTTGNQYFSTHHGTRGIARDAAGNFVVIWTSVGQDGSGQGVFGQRFNPDGTHLGTEFQVNTYTTGQQGAEFRDDLIELDVSFAPSGEFVVVWVSEQDSSTAGVFGQRFDSTGARAGTEFQLNAYTTDTQEQPAIVHDASGNFVVVWSSGLQDGDGLGVFGRLFDSQGNATSTEFQVNTTTALNQQLPMIANDAAGEFVVAWSHKENDPPVGTSSYNIHAQRFGASATPVGTEFQVNSFTPGRQWFGDIGMDAAGNFTVVWRADDYSIAARQFDTSGTPLGTEIMLTTGAGEPDISMAADGRFLLTWAAAGRPEDTSGIFAARYEPNATPSEPEFLVNDYLADRELSPSAAMSETGSFVVTWYSAQRARDGSGYGVFGKRFCDENDATCDRCVGFDDAIDDDGDGTPNGCDPCTTLEFGQAMSRTRIRVAFVEPGPKVIPAKHDTVQLKGAFALAGAPGAFAGIDPSSDGVRIRVESSFGGEVADFRVPGGVYAGTGTSGWQQRSGGRVWTYIDKSGAINGMRRIVLTDENDKSPNQVKVKLRAGAGVYGVGLGYIPLKAIVTLGGTSAADAGLCGEAEFLLAQCSAEGNAYVAREMDCRN